MSVIRQPVLHVHYLRPLHNRSIRSGLFVLKSAARFINIRCNSAVVTTGKKEEESVYWLCECVVFCCMNVGACVFHYLADAVNYIFPESCQPLMKARAWLVQCYSWDPEELDLLGRKPTIATSPLLPPPPSSLLLHTPPFSSPRLYLPPLPRKRHDRGWFMLMDMIILPILRWLWFVRMQHYYYTVWLPCSFGKKKSMIFTYTYSQEQLLTHI